MYRTVLRKNDRTSAKQRQDDGLPVLQPALRERGEQVGAEARELAGTRGRQAALAERPLECARTLEASQHSLFRKVYINLLSIHKFRPAGQEF